MPVFDNILHIITKKLKFRRLFGFYSTSNHVANIVGKSATQKIKNWKKDWDPIFSDFEWADEIQSYGKVPILLFLGEKRSYVYLLIATPEDKKTGCNLSDDEVTQKALIDKIKKSIRADKTAQHPLEVQFDRFKLDISHCLFASLMPELHPSTEVFQTCLPKKLEVSVYGGEAHVAKPVTLKHNKGMIIEMPGLVPITFVNQSIREGIWSVLAHSRGYL